MSRTIRFRKDSHIPWWANYEWRNWVEITKEEYLTTKYDTKLYSSSWRGKVIYEKRVDKKSAFWETHKDQRFHCKEPGPSKFRNIMEERPLRRSNKNELHKWFKDYCYEPLIDSKQRKREYYT